MPLLTRAAVLFALWLLLTDAVDEPDLLTGVVTALLSAGTTTYLRRHRSLFLTPRMRMLRHAYRPFLLLVTDSARVLALLPGALAGRRQPHGRLRVVDYAASSPTTEDATRRILTEWAASLGPNRYVVGIDAEAKQLIIHELRPAPGPLDPLELG